MYRCNQEGCVLMDSNGLVIDVLTIAQHYYRSIITHKRLALVTHGNGS